MPFGVQVNNTLNVLHGVAVAVTVALSAIAEARRARPYERDEALERVPCVDHRVEALVGSVDAEVVQLGMPVGHKRVKLTLDSLGRLGITGDYALSLCGGLLSEQECHVSDLARLKGQLCMQRAAGIAAVVERVGAFAVLQSGRLAVAVVHADERGLIAVVGLNVGAGQTEEARGGGVVVDLLLAVLVYGHQYAVALKIGARDVLGVLEVDLILLVVVVSREFAVSENGNTARTVGGILDAAVPDLVGLLKRDIIQHRGIYARVAGADVGVRRAVAAFAAILIEGLADRLP